MTITVHVARKWSREAAKWCVLFAICVVTGLAILEMTPNTDEFAPILFRFIGLVLTYSGVTFGWIAGTLSVSFGLFARFQR
jgi:hypothetical protein